MKTAIYIEDGITQIVLTPETSWEKRIMHDASLNLEAATIHKGSFYQCEAGHIRKGIDEDSTIIRIAA